MLKKLQFYPILNILFDLISWQPLDSKTIDTVYRISQFGKNFLPNLIYRIEIYLFLGYTKKRRHTNFILCNFQMIQILHRKKRAYLQEHLGHFVDPMLLSEHTKNYILKLKFEKRSNLKIILVALPSFWWFLPNCSSKIAVIPFHTYVENNFIDFLSI